MQTGIDASSLGIEAESRSTTFVKGQILQSLKSSKDYRRAFVEESVRTSLAVQIKAIREQRKMSRPELAAVMEKAPSWIFRLEDPNEKPPTVSTLLAVADAFDTDLCISFGSFAKLLDRVQTLTPESFQVPSFNEEASNLEKQVAEEARSRERLTLTGLATEGTDAEMFRRIWTEAAEAIRAYPEGLWGLSDTYKVETTKFSESVTTSSWPLQIVYRNPNLEWHVSKSLEARSGVEYSTTFTLEERTA